MCLSIKAAPCRTVGSSYSALLKQEWQPSAAATEKLQLVVPHPETRTKFEFVSVFRPFFSRQKVSPLRKRPRGGGTIIGDRGRENRDCTSRFGYYAPRLRDAARAIAIRP
jgi:hypothetical protein